MVKKAKTNLPVSWSNVLCTVVMREKQGSFQKVFLMFSNIVTVVPLLSLSKLLFFFPLTQVQQIGLVDSAQWKTLPQTSQTHTHAKFQGVLFND